MTKCNELESVAALLINCPYRAAVTDTCDDNVLFVCLFFCRSLGLPNPPRIRFLKVGWVALSVGKISARMILMLRAFSSLSC